MCLITHQKSHIIGSLTMLCFTKHYSAQKNDFLRSNIIHVYHSRYTMCVLNFETLNYFPLEQLVLKFSCLIITASILSKVQSSLQ